MSHMNTAINLLVKLLERRTWSLAFGITRHESGQHMISKLFLTAALILVTTRVVAAVDPAHHKLCADARDYTGCIKAQTGLSESVVEFDFLGKPVIPGYTRIDDPINNIIYYVNPKVLAEKVRGTYGRYISFKYIARGIVNPTRGTSGTSFNIGTASTSCTNIGSSVSCQTTPAQTVNIPGKPGNPGGYRQDPWDVIVDCLEKTGQWDWNQRSPTKWKDLTINPEKVSRQIATTLSNTYCPSINSMTKAAPTKLSKGQPNKDDLRALKVLPKPKN